MYEQNEVDLKSIQYEIDYKNLRANIYFISVDDEIKFDRVLIQPKVLLHTVEANLQTRTGGAIIIKNLDELNNLTEFLSIISDTIEELLKTKIEIRRL